MSGNSEVDQCPFCNAAWGDCMHVKLLADLDREAASRPGVKPSGSTPRAGNVNTSGDDVPAEADGEPDCPKPITGAR